MADRVLVLRRAAAPQVAKLVAGAILIACALIPTMPGPAIGFLLAIGVSLAFASGRVLLLRRPRLRATAEGLWFGGGSTVPWSEVKAIYESGFDVRGYGVRARTAAIAIDFHRRRTLFRLPMSAWLASPFSTGDVDVSPHDTASSTSALVAQLDAMKNVAIGTEDGASIGSAELPPARVVERD